METAASFEARKAPSSYPTNMDQPNLGRTQSRESRPNGLDRVREAARRDGSYGSPLYYTM